MGRNVRMGELLAGVEGAALLRRVLDGPDDFVGRRVEALARLTQGLQDTPAVEFPEMDLDSGYSAWALSYDTMDNALMRAEAPIVERAVACVAPGAALDAACGTGRHTVSLVAAGHRALGVDRSPSMLSIARAKVPDAEFRTGELTALPVEDGSVDLAVCALALTHLRDPSKAIAELSRVVRPGGTIVLSDAHPTFVLIQGQALFPRSGGYAYVRNYVHLHGTYLAAFAAADLVVTGCHEEPMEAAFETGLLAGAAEAARALWAGIPAVLVWILRRGGQLAGPNDLAHRADAS
jgi:ubiquinone/menaquinone biosynthesis C-methylase UbiE